MTNQDYIGDGVYVDYDGYGIWLRTERENGIHEIYLEPDVFYNLAKYALNHFRGVGYKREDKKDERE